jgi:hypothetical protein
MGLHHLDGHDHGGLLSVPRPALGKAWSEHARDALSFPLGRVGAAVQPGAQFRRTNAEGLGGSPAAPPTAFELRAQPCSDGAFEVPAVDLIENRLDAFFTRLHIHPSAHDHSVLNLATMQRQANVDSRGETGVRRSAGSMSLGADRPCSAFPAVRVGSRCATSAAANWRGQRDLALPCRSSPEFSWGRCSEGRCARSGFGRSSPWCGPALWAAS